MYDRLKAFGIHLGVSVLVGLSVLWLVFYFWYPIPLNKAVGVTQIFLLLLMIDVILGPLLTLIVYKKGKKSLKLDLSVIALVQLGALVYGLNALAEARPAWLVFSADRFDVVRVLDLDLRYADKVKPEYQLSLFSAPRWVAALPPEGAEANSTITLEAVYAGLDYAQRPYLYHPLSAAANNIRKHAQELDALNTLNPPDHVKKTLTLWPEADAWLPIMANVSPMVVLINREKAEVVAIVNLRPWADD